MGNKEVTWEEDVHYQQCNFVTKALAFIVFSDSKSMTGSSYKTPILVGYSLKVQLQGQH